ncbi:MAG: T9SS type A sorting domain-containing protein [Flavobacteriales bacterium]
MTWTSGTHHFAVAQGIMSPGGPSQPISISGTADAEFVSGTRVRLTDGFHAGDFSGSGQFRARIDETLGSAVDLVVVTPDPASHVTDNVVHVEKWEKLEIGLQLPEEYQDAIDRFFAHYYSNGTHEFATPDSVDAAHDLNPYADDSLQLVLTLTSPSNAQNMKWGFFMKEADWDGPGIAAHLMEDSANLLHPYNIRFRCAPEEEGLWQFALSIKAPHTATLMNNALDSLLSSGYSFVCDPPLPDNKGYLEVNAANRRILQFVDGTPFFALGTNLADGRSATPPGGLPYTYHQRDFTLMQQAMRQLHSVGGNFVRMFLLPRIFAPEYVNLGVYDAYKATDPCDTLTGMPTIWSSCQYHCWAFDRMLDTARYNNIYVKLCIDPYPPIVAYENTIWGHHAIFEQFIEPYPQSPPQNKYDLKRFFYTDGDTTTTNDPDGVFYYWKRKYKYIMARWGYSVNLAIVEPFNEVDQMLSYDSVLVDDICDENDGQWNEDMELPVTYDHWLTDIIGYVKDSVDLSDPVASPLGESRQLFLVGTGFHNTTNPDFYLPCKNPKVDLIDVHHGMYWGEGELSNAFNASQNYRNAYASIVNGDTIRKPFHQGESNYYALKDHDNNPNTDWYETSGIFSNYDVSFHNEIWASTFFGNLGAANTWHWARVFWWPDALTAAPTDNNPVTGNFFQQVFSNVLGATNALHVGFDSVPIENRTLFHHFKPLTGMLSNPDWQSHNFFGGNYTTHKVYDDTNKIECYYLMNADSNLAIGWVHNLNAFWENQFYLKRSIQNFLGCNDPGAQALVLSGFATNVNLHVTYFPTRMDTTVYPDSQVDSSGTGTVTLDLITEPLNGIMPGSVNDYLDTLHSDYAFIIALQPIEKSMIASDENQANSGSSEWDFFMYPNPAHDVLNVLLPTDGIHRDVALYDLTGKRIYSGRNLTSRALDIPTGSWAKGAYCVRVSDPAKSKMKILIIH